ncbi:TolC family protein [Cecembia rubra]|uniref:Outer membrane protein TolC n=1 Tax=Cecembia rubra TaxID=1485585 RepID=A0A2P8EDS6_9BACT|nr:TolC family protein [Cecembia rubra]PSL07632.1 outer membrane protein TolC [Cecembia rubra]
MRVYFIIIGLLVSTSVWAQESLTFETYLDWVRGNHPVAKLADVNLRFGEQELLAARGGFDPKIFADYSTKKFKNTEYYDTRQAGIGIPTWGGVELKGIVEQNTGVFLNPEQTVPADGLVALGASVNIGQGLFIDNRRAALRQAQIFRDATKAERIQILNDLYLDATDAYWKWAADYNNLKVFEEGLRLAEQRFEMVKESFIQGDFPAIDTVEAYTQVMDRLYRFQNAQINFFKSTQYLNTFLWDQEEDPMDLIEGIFPENVLEEMLFDYSKESLRTYVFQHPELQLKDFDIASTEVERRFKAEMLKPVLRFNYNFLTETFNPLMVSPFLENNYKMGFTFAMPMFLRKERGSLGLTKAKLDFKNYERDLKFVQLKNKLESEIYNYETVDEQLKVFFRNVSGLQRLLDGEMMRFEVGESSLFLVNAREVSLFNAQVTLNELAAKRKTAYAKMLNAAGLGFEE